MPIPGLLIDNKRLIAGSIFRDEPNPGLPPEVMLSPATKRRVHAVAVGSLPAYTSPDGPALPQQILVFVDPAVADCDLAAIDAFVAAHGQPRQIVPASRFKATAAAGDAVSYYNPTRYNLPPVTLGTLGARVTVRNTIDDYILSCNHVLAHNGRAPERTSIVSPGPMDDANNGSVVGKLAYWVDLQASPWPLQGVNLNQADCALARVDARYAAEFRAAFCVPAPPLPSLQDLTPVAKVGHATGTTQGLGSIFDIDGFIDFTFGPYFFGLSTSGPAGTLALPGTGMMGVVGSYDPRTGKRPPFAAPGDSGALVWSEASGEGVGLVMARSYAFDKVTNQFTGYVVLLSPLAAIRDQLTTIINPPAPLDFYRAP